MGELPTTNAPINPIKTPTIVPSNRRSAFTKVPERLGRVIAEMVTTDQRSWLKSKKT